jgi:hypothetical protein
VTFTRIEPSLVYDPWAVTTPLIAGTVKLFVPEPVVLLGGGTGLGAVEDWPATGFPGVGEADDPGAIEDAELPPLCGAPEEMVAAGLPEAVEDPPAWFDPVAPHADKPPPAMTTAMITAEVQRVFIFSYLP